MKTNQINTPFSANKKPYRISVTSLLSWITVLVVILVFWVGMAKVYQSDAIPHTLAKIEHKEHKFLASHKAIQKKLTGFRNLV